MLAACGKIRWPFEKIWNYKIPPSIRIFVYLLLKNRLLTHDLMIRRGFDVSPTCELCDSGAVESSLHLFFQCPTSVRLWDRMTAILGVPLMHRGMTVQETWQISASRAASVGMGTKQWHVYFVSTCWFIWKGRNKKIFDGKVVPGKVVEEHILQEAKLWLRLC